MAWWEAKGDGLVGSRFDPVEGEVKDEGCWSKRKKKKEEQLWGPSLKRNHSTSRGQEGTAVLSSTSSCLLSTSSVPGSALGALLSEVYFIFPATDEEVTTVVPFLYTRKQKQSLKAHGKPVAELGFEPRSLELGPRRCNQRQQESPANASAEEGPGGCKWQGQAQPNPTKREAPLPSSTRAGLLHADSRRPRPGPGPEVSRSGRPSPGFCIKMPGAMHLHFSRRDRD